MVLSPVMGKGTAWLVTGQDGPTAEILLCLVSLLLDHLDLYFPIVSGIQGQLEIST